MMHSLRALALPLVSVAHLALPAQRVLVVDAGGGGGAFTTIQAAVDASSPGDTVLVRPGSYAAPTISTALALIGDGSGVQLDGLTISNTAPGANVTVRGVEVRLLTNFFIGDIARIESCAGEVWLQDVRVNNQQAVSLGGTGLAVRGSDAVTMIDCDVGILSGTSLVVGIGVSDSNLQLFGCTATGGTSRSGLTASDSTVYLQGSTITGGEGAAGIRGCGFDGAPGLAAVGTSSVIALGSTFVGGPPGFSLPVFCSTPTAQPGPPTQVDPTATLTTIAATPLRLRAPGVAREMQPVDYAIEGEPGDALVLAFAVRPQSFFFPLIQSPLLVGTSFIGIPVGTLPASGTRTIPTTVPSYGPGVQVERYFVQVLALRANGSLIGGSAQALTLLDSAF